MNLSIPNMERSLDGSSHLSGLLKAVAQSVRLNLEAEAGHPFPKPTMAAQVANHDVE